MPKQIVPELRARAVRLVTKHRGEYLSLTAASAAVAKQLGVGQESDRSVGDPGRSRCRRSGRCHTLELEEIRKLRPKPAVSAMESGRAYSSSMTSCTRWTVSAR